MGIGHHPFETWGSSFINQAQSRQRGVSRSTLQVWCTAQLGTGTPPVPLLLPAQMAKERVRVRSSPIK